MSTRTTIVSLLSVALLTACASAQGPTAGDAAPPITFEHLLNAPQDTSVHALDFDDLPHDTVLIEFWGTWCAPCVAAIPHLNDLHDEFGDEITFISVTFEEPELIKRFLKARSMNSWIGCDTDRSMVEAYDIAGWPTTFLVRDGVIAARTHPASLESKRIRQWLDGDAESPIAQRPARTEHVAEQVGPDGRPPIGTYSAGLDPFSKLDERPLFQLIVRQAGETNRWTTDGNSATLLGATPQQIISTLWELPRYAVQGGDWLTEETYDVIYEVPMEHRDVFLPLVRDLTAKTIGFDIEFAERPLDGYTLKAADGGITLPDAVSDSAGWSMNSDAQGNVTVTSTSMSLDTVAEMIGSRLHSPIINATDSDKRYFVEVTVNLDDVESLQKALREQCGLVLEQTKAPTEVAIVTRTTPDTSKARPKENARD